MFQEVLQDLGIDVWVLRPSPEVLEQHREIKPEMANARVAVTGADGKPQTAATLPPQAAPTPQATAAVSETVDLNIAVLCVSTKGALALFETSESVGSGRIVTDLLSVLAGDWQISTRKTEFRWPPVGAPKMISEDSARAFGAFVEKQMQECDALWVLATATVIDRLTNNMLDDKLIAIPALQKLGSDGETKRRLWRQIQTRLS